MRHRDHSSFMAAIAHHAPVPRPECALPAADCGRGGVLALRGQTLPRMTVATEASL